MLGKIERTSMRDRKDGYLIRDIDPMHYIMPLIYPGRCDNEAYISERIDLSAINAWLEKENAKPGNAEFKYTMFHVLVACLMKTVHLRPKMNRFIANDTMYQRKKVTASFVVKKLFADDGAEGLAILDCEEKDTIYTLHEKLYKQISVVRSDKLDASSDAMSIVTKLPRWISRPFVKLMCVFDRHGWVPKSLIATDPYYTTVLFSNIGSIGLKCGYHHLTNWGTNSIFCLIGEIKDGQVDIGLTIDERLADGYYYSKTIKLLKYLTQHPELLEKELIEKVDYEQQRN